MTRDGDDRRDPEVPEETPGFPLPVEEERRQAETTPAPGALRPDARADARLAGHDPAARLAGHDPSARPHGDAPTGADDAAAAADLRAIPSEILGFEYTIQRRKPTATRVIAGLLVGIYALGATWGAPDLTPALVAMGALVPERVRDGEIGRLLSAAFLHGDLVHLAANTFVLWQLGTSVERLLGTARFLVLYALSAVGGSLLSLAFLQGVSVGASGAIWGLMCGLFALSFRTRQFPAYVRSRVRGSLVQTLVINVLVSTAPGIDWAAHAGGGLTGAALVGSGLLLHGVPNWGVPARAPPLDRVPTVYRAAAVAAALVMAGAVVAALAIGRPWALAEAPALGRAAIAPGWTADVPAGLSPGGETDDGRAYGDLRLEMARVVVAVLPAPEAAGPGAAGTVYEALAASLAEGAADGVAPEAVARETVGAARVLVARWAPLGGVVTTQAFSAREGVVVRATVYRRAEASAAWDEVAAVVAASARGAEGP